MKRTQLQLDEQMWEAIRARAFKEDRSAADIIREMIQAQLKEIAPEKKYTTVDEFSFIASGASRGQGRKKVV